MSFIVGAYETPYTRHPPSGNSTETYLVDAVLGAVADAGLDRDDVDGFGVSSFSLRPDHAIDLAWRLGLRLRWLMEDTCGGASGLNMLQHALRAIEAGDAQTIVLCAGDRIDRVIQGQADVRGVDVDRMRKSFVERSPLQRMSTAEDIASLAAFLCSEGARNISGQCIPVTAGEPAS